MIYSPDDLTTISHISSTTPSYEDKSDYTQIDMKEPVAQGSYEDHDEDLLFEPEFQAQVSEEAKFRPQKEIIITQIVASKYL